LDRVTGCHHTLAAAFQLDPVRSLVRHVHHPAGPRQGVLEQETRFVGRAVGLRVGWILVTEDPPVNFDIEIGAGGMAVLVIHAKPWKGGAHHAIPSVASPRGGSPGLATADT